MPGVKPFLRLPRPRHPFTNRRTRLPKLPEFGDPFTTWLVLAMATTLAGNLTLLGSVANLIVAETAATVGVRLTYGEYLRAGVPITILSIVWGVSGYHGSLGNGRFA